MRDFGDLLENIVQFRLGSIHIPTEIVEHAAILKIKIKNLKIKTHTVCSSSSSPILALMFFNTPTLSPILSSESSWSLMINCCWESVLPTKSSSFPASALFSRLYLYEAWPPSCEGASEPNSVWEIRMFLNLKKSYISILEPRITRSHAHANLLNLRVRRVNVAEASFDLVGRNRWRRTLFVLFRPGDRLESASFAQILYVPVDWSERIP